MLLTLHFPLILVNLSFHHDKLFAMVETNQEPRKWVGYPSPKEGPNVPFIRTDDKNPAFRGWLLVVVGWLYVSS